MKAHNKSKKRKNQTKPTWVRWVLTDYLGSYKNKRYRPLISKNCKRRKEFYLTRINKGVM